MFVIRSDELVFWPNFVLLVVGIQKKLLKMIRLACSNAYDDVEDFEICGIHKNTEI